MSTDDGFSEACEELARSLVDAMLDSDEVFTVVGLILVDVGGTESDGEFWPDAQQVTFTDPEPAPERERPARERLQDWIARSGDLLEDDDR